MHVAVRCRWHYRSRHEDLITFSNYRFYGGQLITYPRAETSRPDLGVELYVIDGIYRRGGRRDNPAEAEFIAERVLFHAREHPDLTVGVVAHSSAQAETVEDIIDHKRAQHPELDEYFAAERLDGFFVKNLENVQGDERDIILLSIGYGPDEAGKFTMNFGPINREGGRAPPQCGDHPSTPTRRGRSFLQSRPDASRRQQEPRASRTPALPRVSAHRPHRPGGGSVRILGMVEIVLDSAVAVAC